MEVGNITIKQAEMLDSKGLSSLMTALGYPTSEAQMFKRLQAILPQPNQRTLIAMFDDKIGGMIGASYHNSYEQDGLYVRISALVTHVGLRNKGIAKALVNAIEEWSIELEANSVILNCGNRAEREKAHQFYLNRDIFLNPRVI